jgi:hypothetical protein
MAGLAVDVLYRTTPSIGRIGPIGFRTSRRSGFFFTVRRAGFAGSRWFGEINDAFSSTTEVC